MWRFERNTARRGRSAVPRTFLRTRRWRRSRASVLLSVMVNEPRGRRASSLGRLPGLPEHPLVGVADALALVGLGLADLADVGGDLADELLVDARHLDARRDGRGEGDALGGVDVHRVAEPQRHLEPRGRGGRGAVADAHDLELAREAL